MKRYVLLICLFALVAGGCAQYYQGEPVVDPETGKTVNVVYLDPSGWSIDRIASAKEPNAKWWYYYDEVIKGGGDGTQMSQITVEIWNKLQGDGMYKVLLHVDRGNPNNFVCFAITVPRGMSLEWTSQSAIELCVVNHGDTTFVKSTDVIFSKNLEREMLQTSVERVIISNDGTWDSGKWPQGQGRILATVQFPFAGKEPDAILGCVPRNVGVVGAALSSSR